MLRNFDEWLNSFRSTINRYDYYTDFNKVYENANLYKVELHALNSLIGSTNIKEDFVNICIKFPQVLSCIPILLAKRETQIVCCDDDYVPTVYDFEHINQTIEQYCIFMDKTGLFDLLQKHLINNLYDYVIGVETGLDSNARKNRGGKQMATLVERYIRETGLEYYTEMSSSQIEEKWDINLSRITNGSRSSKRFDFVVKTRNQIYGIETNFFSGSGSKLNETARSYKELAQESQFINGFTFVWITDGYDGWYRTRRNLRETFDVMEHLYNINDLKNGILFDVFK